MVARGKSRRGKERQGEAGIIREARSQAGFENAIISSRGPAWTRQ